MAAPTKAWNDGSGDSLTITASSGEGDASLEVSSPICEGIDRSLTVEGVTTKGTPSASASITVIQLGLREVFNASDGAFLLSDGTTFNVLKQ